MATWFERGLPVLLEAVEGTFERIATDARTENATIREQLEAFKSRAEAAEKETLMLRDELSILRRDATSGGKVSTDHGTHSVSDDTYHKGGLPTQKPTGSSEGYDIHELRQKYRVLQRKFEKLDSNYKCVKAAYTKQKRIIQEWKTKFKDLESLGHEPLRGLAEGRTLQDGSHKPESGTSPNPGRDSVGQPTDNDDSREQGENPTLREYVSAEDDITLPGLLDERDAAREAGNRPEISWDESADTVDGGEPNLPPPRHDGPSTSVITVKVEPSSDGPIFIETRAVKKRGAPNDNNSRPLQRLKVVKSEPGSSQSEHRAGSLNGESLDLDEVGQKLSTPRKQKMLADALALLSESEENPLHVTNAIQVLPDSAASEPKKEASAMADGAPLALASIDPNARLIRPLTAGVRSKPKKNSLAEGIASVAEDGNSYRNVTRLRPTGVEFGTPQPNRLEALLGTPPAGDVHRVVLSAPPARNHSRHRDHQLGAPDRRELPFSRSSHNRVSSDTPSRAGSVRFTNSKAPRGEALPSPKVATRGSLRNKDADTLRPEDFKVNPAFNDGQNYAFSAVVRGKADRSCLPGCADANCCGKNFRAVAEAQRRNCERVHSDDLLLFEEYLGDNISRILGMSNSEKEELWLEAKTWQLANRYGKHRQHYTRMPSPPGFWNAEFPSTQEVQAEKVEAEKMQKQLVRERYREAMRPGGRWVFRDE